MTALLGTRHRWQAINRTGIFSAEADPATSVPSAARQM